MELTERRDALIADDDLGGRELCTALAAATDELLVDLYGAAARPRRKGAIALLAVGGYGRGELAPFSDLDLLLVHERKAAGVDELAAALWYPLWDAGLKLGHAVRTVDDQLALVDTDLDTATALLTTRYLAGDAELAARVATESRARWRKRAGRRLEELRDRRAERRDQRGEVAYLLEPDLKDGFGGLRDVQALGWAAVADMVLAADDRQQLAASYDHLLEARVALHRVTGRPGDVLRLQDQDAVAAKVGAASADALMATVAAAARTIVWISDGAWRDLGRHEVGRDEPAAPGVAISDRAVELTAGADPSTDPALLWRVARVAAERDLPIGRAALDRLRRTLPEDAWPPGARDELVDALACGHRVLAPFEALDQQGLIDRALPEWALVRSRPQRNAYHRFTVDRHLWEAAAQAAALTDRVARPDLLLLGALLHDLGKGYPGDHTEVGMALVAEIAPRLGLDDADTAVLVRLVEHHLLLADLALRRDLADPATLRVVREAVGDEDTLHLLHALTEADSRATGPSAWGNWKQQLVADLVARTAASFAPGDSPCGSVPPAAFPDAPTIAAMALGDTVITVDDDDRHGGTHHVTVVAPDRVGVFARAAGALSLHGLDVLTAWAAVGDYGGGPMAASRFRVRPPRSGFDWAPVRRDAGRALAGQLAIAARLAERSTTYRRRRPLRAEPVEAPRVSFHDDASDAATVIEVRAPNGVGVLFRIANAIAELGLDIRHATVQSMDDEVIDTFYVAALDGGVVADPFHRGEVERAVLHALRDASGGAVP